MGSAEHFEALSGLYAAYAEEYQQRIIDNGPFHGLHKFLLGNSTAGDRKADTGFFKAVEQTVDALCHALTEEGDGTSALQALRLMILDAEGTDQSSALMMEAAQSLAIPLVPFVSREECGDILAAYRSRYPKKRMLSPKQRELLAALESRANGS